MWEKINTKFKKYPARIRVAEKMIELGLSISEDGRIYCGNLKISDKALAESADVDRRAIKSTIEVIQEDEDLNNLFSNIIPAGTLLKNIAKNLKLGVIEIECGSEGDGVLAETTKLIVSPAVPVEIFEDEPTPTILAVGLEALKVSTILLSTKNQLLVTSPLSVLKVSVNSK